MPPSVWLQLLVVAASGAAGALARWGSATLARSWLGEAWLGTLAINTVGCLLYGAAYQWLEQQHAVGPLYRLACLTGFLGAFTTYSTFAFDSYQLGLRHVGLAALDVGLHVALGVAALAAGMSLARAAA